MIFQKESGFEGKIMYIAYGSNMDRSQMLSRCPSAICVGTTYIERWQLTMPFYANIEPQNGARTPALIWQITKDDELLLDGYEGYPNKYEKTDIDISINGNSVSAMAYVMTPKYKLSDKKAREGYEEQIRRAYVNEGFSEDEFSPSYVRKS
jgi:hypothetical protein